MSSQDYVVHLFILSSLKNLFTVGAKGHNLKGEEFLTLGGTAVCQLPRAYIIPMTKEMY